MNAETVGQKHTVCRSQGIRGLEDADDGDAERVQHIVHDRDVHLERISQYSAKLSCRQRQDSVCAASSLKHRRACSRAATRLALMLARRVVHMEAREEALRDGLVRDLEHR